jgi:hypothetical protein
MARAEQERAAKSIRIKAAGKKWKLADGSAEFVVDNPWVETWLDKIENVRIACSPRYDSTSKFIEE